ncbi:hypothetical protein YC2023_072210 [Brassica napus]
MTRIEFTTACQDAPGVLSLDFGQPHAVTHGRSASVPYPREDGGTNICDTQPDVPSARKLGAPLAFKDSMALVISGSYAYDPTKTEVLGMDERITMESAGTVRNRPTKSDWTSRNVADGKPPVTPPILDRIVGTAMVRGKHTSRS